MDELEMLVRAPHVETWYGYELSPDGRQAAFAWNHTAQWEIYVTELDGSSPPRQVTSGPGAKLSPRWAPGGRLLACALDLDGGEQFDILLCDLQSGEQISLTPGSDESIQPAFAWSPDGREISFCSERSGRFEAYTFVVAQGLEGFRQARCILALPSPAFEARWSPVGDWIAVSVEAGGQDIETWIAPHRGGEAFPIGQNGAPVPASEARWSPDGRRLAFSSDLSGVPEIGVFDLQRRSLHWVARAEPGFPPTGYLSPAWTAGGQALTCVQQCGPRNSITVQPLDDGAPWHYELAPGIHTHPEMTVDGRLVYQFESPAHPAGLWTLNRRQNVLTRLTPLLPDALSRFPFTLPGEVEYPSHDGEGIPALLYRPAAREGCPAVVWVHGGPNWLSQCGWDPLIQTMVRRGWVVLAPNYRGSTGYGRDWQVKNRFDLGAGDAMDVAAGAEYLIRQGLARPERMAVTGRSHGGYLTMVCLTRYPELWSAGSAVVPFLNWFTGHAASREDVQHWDLENFGDPVQDAGRYYERSPLFFLERVQAPVQLICGAHDPRCPAAESLQAKEALDALGKPCELALYPDEGHAFLKIENVLDAERRRLRFLAAALERDEEKKEL